MSSIKWKKNKIKDLKRKMRPIIIFMCNFFCFYTERKSNKIIICFCFLKTFLKPWRKIKYFWLLWMRLFEKFLKTLKSCRFFKLDFFYIQTFSRLFSRCSKNKKNNKVILLPIWKSWILSSVINSGQNVVPSFHWQRGSNPYF